MRCYFCGNESSGKEHVPPQCLFPESKDVGGLNLRKNLITVPSCDLHNQSKSHDDEFLMVSMAGIINNNKIGVQHFYTKVNRVLKRKEKDFLNKQILRNLKHITVPTVDNKYKVATMGYPNYERLVKCFESIARGLYFHKSSTVFVGEITVLPGFIEYTNVNLRNFKDWIKYLINNQPEMLEVIEGENPQVFQYQFIKPDKDGLFGLKMLFYEKNEIFVAFKPEGTTQQFNLALEMLKGGFKVTINTGDSSFEFN